jgi:hypothetical protein
LAFEWIPWCHYSSKEFANTETAIVKFDNFARQYDAALKPEEKDFALVEISKIVLDSK